ncbi:MAG: hypothetical protein BWK76_24610 [Desulfobulbaceae bacterium A2]|nr:MAG: hypothetical protein BWK76_24610 [Desulfobulbaceae bacterium A2]
MRTTVARLVLLVCLPLLLAACGGEEETRPVAPAVYLLQHNYWTSALVLNFNTTLAPFGDDGEPLVAGVPHLEPALEGEWRWQDPSRLVFLPSRQTIAPDTTLRIALRELKLRPGYRPAVTELTFRTPPLQIMRQECRWRDSNDTPLRRALEFTAEFNYPVRLPAVAAVLGNGSEIAIQSGTGTSVIASSEALLRPGEDTTLTATFKAGTVELLSQGGAETMRAPLAKGATCTVPVQRGDWDKLDAVPKAVPTVTGIEAEYAAGRIALSLLGESLRESATRTRAGEPVRAGVTSNPPLAGSWSYGEEAGGSDLILTPVSPAALQPGVTYALTVENAVFPELTFEQPQFSAKVTLPPLTAAISDMRLHVDPRDAKIKRAVATLRFSHPPNRDVLAAKTALHLRLVPAREYTQAIAYELSYDEKNPLLVYLKSTPLQLAEDPGELRLELDKGLAAAVGGEPTTRGTSRTLALASARDYLQISSLDVHSVLKDDESIERLIMLHSNVPLQEPAALDKAVTVYVLPDCRLQNTERPALCAQKEVQQWRSADQVDEDVLRISTPVPVRWRDSGSEDKTIQHLSCTAPEKRYLFIRVAQGLESIDGFRLGKDARFVRELGANRRELKILHEGSLLSLSGDKKLGVTARGVAAVQVELQRILPHNLHHLAALTSSWSAFQKPDFRLPIEHFAEKFEYDEALPVSDERMERQYFAVDFGRFLRDNELPRGLFLLTVREKPPEGAAPGQGRNVAPDQRLVLLTDMGLLVKTGREGHQDVFVMSFRSGTPVADAQVSLLGRNGVALFTAKTDDQGRVRFPPTAGLKAEKTPTVFLAEKDGDLSFLPCDRSNRQVNLSRFDTDGLQDSPDTLHAYLFSDRGIYRPGETVHLGMILRKRDWSALPAGLPLKVVISDPQEQEIWSRTVAFGAEGFEEIRWTSPVGGKTGGYQIELIVADKDKTSLGSTKVRVEEFQPDRLQVKTEIADAPAQGWLSPDKAAARVSVRNLFGTAAAGNASTLELTARPWSGQVPGYAGYRFRRTSGGTIPEQPQDLGEIETDDQGEALFDLPLSAITEPIYEITVAGEGFEKGSGRSVVATASALISRQDYILGYKADGRLDYLAREGRRSLELLAVGSDFQVRSVPTVQAELFETRYVSTLVQRRDGLYQYQSVARQELRNRQTLNLREGRTEFVLPSDTPGTFFVLFKNEAGEELNRVDYTVAGQGNVTRSIEHNAELQLTLDKKEYQPGETMELQIVAPYYGAGLITVEQDGVLVSQWFKSETTASSHRITLPEGISGNGYVSVAFVRSLDSPEVYMSPLSYGVAPFTLSRQRYTQEFSIEVPDTVRPGGNLEVRYQAAEATRMVLYAVDEGILQFARYSNPAPLEHFFSKRALQVRTHQILDLILPDFALLQRLSTPGGDGDDSMLGKYKNPFARKNKPPMAFWSGLLEVQPGAHRLSIPVPDYFNGRIRVIAVTVNAGKVAVPVSQSVTSQPYVLQPQQPLVVAPGDEFDMGVLVANTSGVPGSQSLHVRAMADAAALEIVSANPLPLELAEGRDASVRFRARAKEKLGPVKVRYQVGEGDSAVTLSEEISIRPAQPLLTTLQGGVLTLDEQRHGNSRTLEPQRDLHAEQRQVDLTVSITPAGYLRGIVEYLKHYPYGCTEQIVSQAFPAAVLGANSELGLSPEDVARQLERALHTLHARQKHDGSFGYWTAADAGHPLYSMYVTHFLLEASEHGHQVNEALLERALRYADSLTQGRQYDHRRHEAKAYALYLLARHGRNVAPRLRAFEGELAAHLQASQEPATPMARFFLGAAFKLHHLDADADRLFGAVQRQWRSTGLLPPELRGNPETLSLYLYLVGRHFSALLDDQDPQFGSYLLELAQDLLKQRVNSFRGSLALLGLGSMWTRFEQQASQGFTVLAGTPPAPLAMQGQTLQSASLAAGTRPLELRGEKQWNLYYQLSERGYDRAPSKTAITEQLTINRSLLDDRGEKLESLGLEDKLHLRIALHPDRPMKDVAVVLLVPGGFEIDLGEEGLANRQSLPIGNKPLWQPDYIDVQEDRLVLFGALDGGERYFEFRLKPLNSGTYRVPPVFAEGMYDTTIQYRGLADVIRVTD